MSRWRSILFLPLGLSVAAVALAAQDAPAPQPEPRDSPADEAPTAVEPPPGRVVTGTITGTVSEGKKRPVPGCMVQLTFREQDGLLRVTGTDEKGHYVFKDLPAGTYDIAVGTEQDSLSKKERIEVRPPFRNIVDFELAPRASGKSPPDAGEKLAQELKQKAAAGPGSVGGGTPEDPPAMVPVRGIFLDVQRRPIAEISIMLLSLDDKGTFQAYSDVDGTFSLPAVAPGPYRVLVVSPGYVSIDLKRVAVSSVNGLNLSLTLVDYPLTFKGRTEDHLPAEEPLRAPADGL